VKFKLDEDTPLRLAALLPERGHEADTVQDDGLANCITIVDADRIRIRR
jgi:hypothetical protein